MTKKQKREWFDDDALWRDLFPYMFPPKRFLEAEEDADRVIALTRPGGTRVLDLACGPGRVAVAMALRGFSVTGVDRTKFLLDRAKTRARRAGARIEWVREDMRDFIRPDTFDLALSLFTSFGYFEDREDDLRVLRNVFASLKPGGAFLIDVVGKECLARDFTPAGTDPLEGGGRVVQCREIVEDWTRVRNEWIVLEKGRSRSFHFDLTVYSGQELKDRLAAAGCAEVRLYGSLAGTPYDREARRLVAVARKAAG